MDADNAARGDGIWVPVRIAGTMADPPLIYKTLLHPDRLRPWAEVFVTAIDLRRTQLHLVSGTLEPRARSANNRRYALGQGLVPERHRHEVVAGFNGGFKAEHGQYGMMVDHRVLLPAVPWGCTVLGRSTQDVEIAVWPRVSATSEQSSWWRQTPPCLIEQGELGPGMHDDNTAWGAAVGGSTVIRRSALGLSRDRKTLIVAVTNDTTAPALALAMAHAGAQDAAQLDVNWSHTRFVVFDAGPDGHRVARGLFEGFVSEPDMYVRKPSLRDFFYLTTKRDQQV
jgi:hypothetical protein